MFTDSVKISIASGKGGDGVVSFRREKFEPLGGPDGGDGGNGGSVYIEGDENINTLVDYRYNQRFKADDGERGKNKNQYGKAGKDITLKVPVGTIVKEFHTGGVIVDIVEHGQKFLIAKGGKGGRGNVKFATSTRRAPQFAEPGKKGKDLDLQLELKVIADVGLIGLPNVGKSSILATISEAKPKIENYHFTTLSPNLGVVKISYEESFVVADIPGLVEGASEGIGLGHDFLKHIERTKILAHVIDMAGTEGRNPLEDFYMINQELEKYSDKLRDKKQVLILNKYDLEEADTWYELLQDQIKDLGLPVYKTSAATTSGLKDLKYGLWDMVKNLDDEYETFDYIMYEEEEIEEYTIENLDGILSLTGPFIEDLVYRTNFESYESLFHFFQVLTDKGIMDEMKKMGLERGDTILIDNIEFEYEE